MSTTAKIIKNTHVNGCPKLKFQPTLGYGLGIINLGSFLSLINSSLQSDSFMFADIYNVKLQLILLFLLRFAFKNAEMHASVPTEFLKIWMFRIIELPRMLQNKNAARF